MSLVVNLPSHNAPANAAHLAGASATFGCIAPTPQSPLKRAEPGEPGVVSLDVYVRAFSIIPISPPEFASTESLTAPSNGTHGFSSHLKPIPHPPLRNQIPRPPRISLNLLPQLPHVHPQILRFLAVFPPPHVLEDGFVREHFPRVFQ